ncbi:MAG: HAMP domain-containing protein [Polyangiaceae bacterium]|nr:HAMP domain-containing protein [Polyangiaceae bacterium]
MRSLFLRIFLSFWAAMTLIGAAFALIYALSFPSIRGDRRLRLATDSLRLHGAELVLCRAAGDLPACDRELGRVAEATGLRVHLFAGAEPVLSQGPTPAAAAALVARLADAPGRGEDGEARASSDEEYLLAVALGEPGPGRIVALAQLPRARVWLRYLDLDTLPLRVAVLFLVSGLASYLIARYLTRPLRTLRSATQRIAGGDFAVRVSPELGRGDREVAALARDFDRMAEHVEEQLAARQQLLRDVSHELRSPLARLRVALELARQRSGPDAGRALDRIEREAERLTDLIGQMLAVTRLEAEVTPGERHEVDVSALLAEVVRDADFEARSTGRRVELGRNDPATLAGNEEVLRRAIENVLRNAVRFTAERTAVEVALVRADGELELRVRDHGPGVPAAELEEIFRPFYRVGADRDRRTGGVGIGLAITERAVTVHGGKLRADNAPGGGLLVTFRFPLQAAAPGAPGAA